MRNVDGKSNVEKIDRQFLNAASAPSKKTTKTPFVGLRVTEAEMAQLKHLSAGMSVSAYVRHCLFGENAAPRKVRSRVPIKDQQALGRVLSALGQTRIANNLNQIAYEANCGSLLLDVQTDERLNEACQHVKAMRADLVKALGVGDGAAQ